VNDFRDDGKTQAETCHSIVHICRTVILVIVMNICIPQNAGEFLPSWGPLA